MGLGVRHGAIAENVTIEFDARRLTITSAGEAKSQVQGDRGCKLTACLNEENRHSRVTSFSSFYTASQRHSPISGEQLTMIVRTYSA
jgi:hypothetical protein